MKQIFSQNGVTIGLDESIPEVIETGDGTLLYISGWYSHHDDNIERLFLRVNEEELSFSGIPYLRNKEDNSPITFCKKPLNKEKRAFWFLVPITLEKRHSVDISLVLHLKKSRLITIYLGKANLVRSFQKKNTIKGYSHEEFAMKKDLECPLIVIGLATYNPDILSLKRQIDSIKNQTYPNWICLVHDDHSAEELRRAIFDYIDYDSRFIFQSHEKNLGFYKNFESIIYSIPKTASFIALCDQDDYWYPDKLMKMVTAFDPDTTLVYSDMRIVESDGSVRFKSFWYNKCRSETLFMTLLNNSITGASCMFRSSLCDKILPFPPDLGAVFHELHVAFHDHWIGCTAMMAGKIVFIDEPLHDYYQHYDNVAGFSTSLSGYKKFREISILFRELGFFPFLTLYYKKFLAHGFQRLCMAYILQLRFKITDPNKLRQLSDLIKDITSGFAMMILVIKCINKGAITGNTDKMLFIGYLSGIILYFTLAISTFYHNLKKLFLRICSKL